MSAAPAMKPAAPSALTKRAVSCGEAIIGFRPETAKPATAFAIAPQEARVCGSVLESHDRWFD